MNLSNSNVSKRRHLWWPKFMPNNLDSVIANEALRETERVRRHAAPSFVHLFFSALATQLATKRLVIRDN